MRTDEYSNWQCMPGGNYWQPAKPMKYPGPRGWWMRLRCEHDWWPEGFADWYCPRCGKDR